MVPIHLTGCGCYFLGYSPLVQFKFIFGETKLPLPGAAGAPLSPGHP